MITFKHFVRSEEFSGIKEESIDPATIKEFGIINHQNRTNKGTFKSWLKSGYITTTNDTFGRIFNAQDTMKEIKDTLKTLNIPFTTEKSTVEAYKNHETRTAIDWSFKVGV